jgi:hypothetical protein
VRCMAGRRHSNIPFSEHESFVPSRFHFRTYECHVSRDPREP